MIKVEVYFLKFANNRILTEPNKEINKFEFNISIDIQNFDIKNYIDSKLNEEQKKEVEFWVFSDWVTTIGLFTIVFGF